MKELVDIHAHILPKTDDGSRYFGETRELLRLAHAQGIRAVTATPHYIYKHNKKTAEQIRKIHQEVQALARDIDPNFKIYLGEELYYFDGIVEVLLSGQALTLNETSYVLVEFSERISYRELYQAVRSLILEGYLPLIAHVERYRCLREKRQGEEPLSELIRMGAFLQMNYTSVSGASGISGLRRLSDRSWCRNAVLEGKIHVMGTDMHRIDFRPPEIETAVRWLEKEGLLDALGRENPERILRGERLD